jgi:hypothetical protein
MKKNILIILSIFFIYNLAIAEVSIDNNQYEEKWWQGLPNLSSHSDSFLLSRRIVGIEQTETIAIGAIIHYNHDKSYRKETWSGSVRENTLFVSAVPYIVIGQAVHYLAPDLPDNKVENIERLTYSSANQYTTVIEKNPSYYSTIGLIFDNEQKRNSFYEKLLNINTELKWNPKPINIPSSNISDLKSLLIPIFKSQETDFLENHFLKYKIKIKVYGLHNNDIDPQNNSSTYSFDFERYSIKINEMDGLNYSSHDELLFFNSENDCLSGQPVANRFLFTESLIKQELLKRKDCWIKVMGEHQKSLCAKGEPIQHTLVFNLASTNQAQKRIILIIADSKVLAQLIARDQIWRNINHVIQFCKNRNLPLDLMALKENQDCKLITQTDDPEFQPVTRLSNHLPLNQSIAKPYEYMRDAIKSKHRGSKIKKIIYIVDSQNLISNPKTEYNLPPASWIDNKLLHVVTDDKCDVWKNQIKADCTPIDRNSFNDQTLIRIIRQIH